MAGISYKCLIAHTHITMHIVLCFRIRSLVTLRDVKEGEELTVDYDYELNDKFTPKWYKELYQAMIS